ncbi:MAG: hypothetical protein AAGE92_00550 [Cyanobacteria bacterium P01_G01_bin.4]
MNYRELQQALKPLKVKGLTDVMLNSREAKLRAEYDRLSAAGHIATEENYKSIHLSNSRNDSRISYMPLVGKPSFSNDLVDKIELDPEIEALVAESWTDDPSLAIATIAAYAVTGFAMLILWIALIATTSVLSGLKCWYWCRQQLANLSLQLKYFEFPLGSPLPTQILVAR